VVLCTTAHLDKGVRVSQLARMHQAGAGGWVGGWVAAARLYIILVHKHKAGGGVNSQRARRANNVFV